MGVKDKSSGSNTPPNQATNGSSVAPLNSKRTFEEFKQTVRSSSISPHNSDSESSEEEKTDFSFEIAEQIDCMGPDTLWHNAEIIAIRNHEVKVHYTGLAAQKEEWISKQSNRLQKQWSKGRSFRLNNRVDVLYEDEWFEGLVVEVLHTRVKVLIPGIKKSPEFLILEKNSENIAEIGTFSNAFGTGRQNSQRLANLLAKEQQFHTSLSKKNLQIKQVQGDGNCLFRAISDQIYGEESFHRAIRRACMDYIELECDFFRNFIVQGSNQIKFREYIVRKREDGIWGDDIEIQALSEIYTRSVEIYAYSDVPMRTFHESGFKNHLSPIKLSYHGNSHFNSIVNVNGKNEEFKEKFGRIEDMAINRARERRENSQGREKEIKELNISRINFTKRDLETALQESLRLFEESLKKMSVRTFEEEESERMIIKSAIEESRNEETELMKRTLEESRREVRPNNNAYLNNTSINRVLNEGFPIEMVLQAYEIVGDDADMMIKFITENLSYS